MFPGSVSDDNLPDRVTNHHDGCPIGLQKQLRGGFFQQPVKIGGRPAKHRGLCKFLRSDKYFHKGQDFALEARAPASLTILLWTSLGNSLMLNSAHLMQNRFEK